MSKRQFLYSGLGALVILAGCAAPLSKTDYASFQSAALGNAEIMPTEAQLQNERLKVVVYDADENAVQWARDSQLGQTLAKAIETTISGGGVEIVDDNIAVKLRDVLKLAEASGKATYSGPKVANFAIKSTVSSAEYGATYNPASRFVDKKGNVSYTPASYSHSAKVKAAIRIYEVPSLRLVQTVIATGTASQSDAHNGANAGMGRAMVRAAALDAVKDYSTDLLKVFASNGYVESKKTNGKKSIFKITLGAQNGLKPGSKVRIYNLQPEADTFAKNNGAVEEIVVADATVTQNLTDTSAWIELTDETNAEKVLRGHVVRPEHTTGTFQEFMRKVKE